MLIYEILKHEVISVRLLKIFGCLRSDLSYSIQHILPHVLISILLKHLSRQLLFLVLSSMYKMAEISSLTPHRPMIVLARNSPIISNLYKLILNLLLLLLNLSIGIVKRCDQTFNLFNFLLIIKSQLN